ncbi:hypothetical protein DI09_588p10, partial [Mitosporidium daphniae]
KYFCPFLANKDLLFKMVLNGSLHPRLYAFIIDRGNESNNRNCKTNQKLIYNIYLDTYIQNQYKTNINEEETDKNRAKIFLNSKKLDLYSQNEDYKAYYSNIKSAELELLNNNPKKATEIYHSVFKKYKEPFLRDVFVA